MKSSKQTHQIKFEECRLIILVHPYNWYHIKSKKKFPELYFVMSPATTFVLVTLIGFCICYPFQGPPRNKFNGDPTSSILDPIMGVMKGLANGDVANSILATVQRTANGQRSNLQPQITFPKIITDALNTIEAESSKLITTLQGLTRAVQTSNSKILPGSIPVSE